MLSGPRVHILFIYFLLFNYPPSVHNFVIF
nr:MAG TPA: hypothetical protein [Caudoviricetes sp.]